MGRSGCFDQTRKDCAFDHCLARFRDANGNPPNSKTTIVIPYATTDLPHDPTSLLHNETDIIVGILVSVTVLILTIVVILVITFWRKYSTEQLSLLTHGSGDRNTNEHEMDNFTVTSDYEQIDNVDNRNKGTKANDQLHVTRIADTDPNTDQSNSSCSGKHNSKYESIEEPNEIYTNTVTSEYEQLDNAEIDKSTKAYDLLHVKHVVDTDPTTIYSKTMISREEHSNYEPIEVIDEVDNNTVTTEYEQLDNDEIDKITKAYDLLHVTHVVDTDPTTIYSKTMISREEHSSYEPIEVINEVDNNTVTSQYEQLDNAETDTVVNVYDQLDVTDMMYTDRLPTTQRP